MPSTRPEYEDGPEGFLYGTLYLADGLYLLGHDAHSGKPLQPPRITGLGLAGALLAELALDGRIAVDKGAIDILDTKPPSDPLAHLILDQLRRESVPARDWLAYLSKTTESQVAERLRAAGVLAPGGPRRLFQDKRLVPVRAVDAGLAAAELCTRLIRGKALTIRLVVFAGLAEAAGLDGVLLSEVREAKSPGLDELASALAALSPTLRELISLTESLIGAAIAMHRA